MITRFPSTIETGLTEGQHDIFRHLCICCDVPIEWAYLVARRCTYVPEVIDSYYYDIVYHAFTWEETEEGYEFWADVFDGFVSEHRSAAKLRVAEDKIH